MAAVGCQCRDVEVETIDGCLTCTVTAIEDETNNTPTILDAFSKCRTGGAIIFPGGEEFWIAERLNPVLDDVVIEWRGQWKMSDDLDYWRNKSYLVAFQNHAAGIVFAGSNISINGYSTGGINGNGEAWYTTEAGDTRPGRPFVSNFAVHRPPLWAVHIMSGTDMFFSNIVTNATSAIAPSGALDTMDATNIHLDGFIYQGGDDCIAIKPRSYNFSITNVTCNGGNGVAIGSLGQYLEDPSAGNIYIEDFRLTRATTTRALTNLVAGGWGNVRNITFKNFDVTDANRALNVNQDNGDNGTADGTSKMLISEIYYKDLFGQVTTSPYLSISCSEVYPCYDILFFDLTIVGPEDTIVTVSAPKRPLANDRDGCDDDLHIPRPLKKLPLGVTVHHYYA
ncbi:putative extracellular exo-polygalacturonase [Xylariaceae sp. FL1272]|nr:putative extracellular exo-polygalacturonase [Xylariaceae sp. FL1272]